MKKSKPNAEAIKPAKEKPAKTQKLANPAEMRQSITDMVGSEMKNITQAVVEEAKKGQLASVKYLFEISGVYPAAADQSRARPEEGETLARLLLTRLGVPLEPVVSLDNEVMQKIPNAAPESRENDEDAEQRRTKDAGKRPEPEAGDTDEEAVVSVC